MQNSVSTRYLGVFPDYLQDVNELLENIPPKDTVVIFEDVLYYGILSKPENFVRMNHMLLSHTDSGGHATIAYYDVSGYTFHRMIREQRVHPEFFAAFDEEYDAMAAEGTKVQSLRRFDEYLIMTCWMVSGHAVLAFPSKYATDEISTHDWQVISNPRDSKYVKKIGNVKLVI